jgi:branched-chain amino acid transport system permease protein
VKGLNLTPKSYLLLGISLAVVAILATLPLYAQPYNIVLLTTIFMYVVLTVSWVLFSGPTRYVSLAPAAFFGVGIYVAALLGKELPLLAFVAVGGLCSFVLALLVGFLTLRLRETYFTIFTFGLVELIRHFMLFWETNVTGTRGRIVVLIDNDVVFYVMLGIFVLTLLVTYIIRRSKFGLALRSIGENEEAAAHRGINVTMVKVLAFAISAFFMGAAGAVIATRWTYIDPYIAFNTLFSFLPILMAIFGGMGQIYGPIIGAVVFAYLEEVLLTKFPYYYMLIFGVVLVVVILFLPDGLVGLVQGLMKRRKLREQHAGT